MEGKGNPLVSVIVRTKNRPGLLATALRSIESQDYRPLEVVLVNDGGCELNIESVKTLVKQCSLIYIRFEESKGRAEAGNAGISVAHGEYIAFLDDDDEYLPDHVSTLIAVLKSNDYRIAYADTEIVNRVDDPCYGRSAIKERKVFASYDFSYRDLVIENYIPLISIVFYAGVVKECGGFDTTFDLYEDWDLLLRIGEHHSFYHVEKVTSIYNQWNKTYQIAQVSEPLRIQHAAARIFTKHQNKMTPDVILNLKHKHGLVVNELKALQRKFACLESEMTERDSEKLRQKDAELRQKDAELRQRDAELRQRDAELRQKVLQLQQTLADLARTSSEVEMLRNENTRLMREVSHMKSTLGWQLLEKMREIRKKTLPEKSARGKIYHALIERLKGAKRIQ